MAPSRPRPAHRRGPRCRRREAAARQQRLARPATACVPRHARADDPGEAATPGRDPVASAERAAARDRTFHAVQVYGTTSDLVRLVLRHPLAAPRELLEARRAALDQLTPVVSRAGSRSDLKVAAVALARSRSGGSVPGRDGLHRHARGGGLPRRGARLARRAPHRRVRGARRAGRPRRRDRAGTTRVEWERILGDDRWVGLSWPEEYGGRGAELRASRSSSTRSTPRRTPRRGSSFFGEGLFAPTLHRSSAPTSRSAGSCRRSSRSRSCGARASPSRTPAPTSRTSRRGPSSTATSG